MVETRKIHLVPLLNHAGNTRKKYTGGMGNFPIHSNHWRYMTNDPKRHNRIKMASICNKPQVLTPFRSSGIVVCDGQTDGETKRTIIYRKKNVKNVKKKM